MNIEQILGVLGGAVVLVGSLYAFWTKWARPRLHSVTRTFTAGRDTLLGREPLYDSITGRELVPALPSMGDRMNTLEQSNSLLTNTVARLADTTQRLDGHEARITRLEKGEQERAMNRTESIELLRTIETAIKSNPKDDA